MNYCLIDTLEKLNKFFINNQFNKTIIKKNKNKVKLSANATLEKFLRETNMLNIVSLAKTKKVIDKKSGVINHSNYHSIVNNTIDISKLVQLLVENGVFEKQFSQICETETLNLFAHRITKLVTKISLHKYQMRIIKNWNKTFPDNNQESVEGNKTNLEIDVKNK